ncbi:MAG TPA: hypothetical protein VFU97_12620 [Xanthobacteraceae bacterium]|nr:hypothetical protein [Xanthobacteraceae bacterium]
MNKQQHWNEIRKDLNAVARKLAANEGGASAREIVAAFIEQRPALVKSATDLLIESALTRLVHDVIKLRADRDIEVNQIELWDRAITEVVAVPNAGSGAGRRKKYHTLGSLPVALAAQMVRHHFERKRRISDPYYGYRDLIEFVMPFVTSESMTLDQAFTAARAAHFPSSGSGSDSAQSAAVRRGDTRLTIEK